jgi:hypothetical protein
MEPQRGDDQIPAVWKQGSTWWEKAIFLLLVAFLVYLILGFEHLFFHATYILALTGLRASLARRRALN